MDVIRELTLGNDSEGHELVREFKEYSLAGMLDKTIKDTKEAAEKRGVEVTTDISPRIPDRLMGDPGIIRLALSSMILSALEYMEGGTIKLSVFAKDKNNSTHLLFSVKDTGSGTKPPAGGYEALALDFADEVLRLTGSELHAIREEGEGSELYFEIDQADAAQVEAEKAAGKEAADDNKIREENAD